MFATRGGATKLALLVVIGLVVFKLVVAVVTRSISISAQAVDSFLDLFAIALTFFAIRVANRPADEEHPFGHGKVEGMAAIGEVLIILVAGGLLVSAAVRRIIEGATIELTEAGMGVMLFSVIVSIFLSRHLLKVSQVTSSLALEALARNIAADVYSAVGVLVGLVAIRFTGLSLLDPIMALGVTFFILKAAYDVTSKSFGELVDVRLPKGEEEAIISSITEHSGQLVGFHEMRTRKAGSRRYVDLHLVMPKGVSVEEAHQICDHLEQHIESRLPNSSVTIHVEPCSIECGQCLVLSCSLHKGNLR